MIGFDPLYLLYVAPALLLAMWAQGRVRASYAEAGQIPARLTGAAAARHLLDSAGLQHIPIEPVAGQLTDHYDPKHKVLRLSEGVYAARNLAAVGIAAHEAGHAIQDATRYLPLVVRNLAVPLAQSGSGLGMLMIVVGAMLGQMQSALGPLLATAGMVLFGGVVFFQVVNLPVEFDASARAKRQLTQYGIVSPAELVYVDRVLDSAAWTYIAATLQAVLTLLYLLSVTRRGNRSDE